MCADFSALVVDFDHGSELHDIASVASSARRAVVAAKADRTKEQTLRSHITATNRHTRTCDARDHQTRAAQDDATKDSDADRMRVLYAEHAAAILRYALRLTGDRARAEDVMQETLLRAWQHPEVTDEHERSVRAWLFTVARHLIVDERRSARFRNESGSADLEGTYDQVGQDGVDSALDRILLSDALVRLSPAHRAVIRRSYYQGWTTAQIAADLNIAEGTVKSRLHYAMRALRLALQEMGYSDTRRARLPETHDEWVSSALNG